MTLLVMALVLCAALLHASWNALLKTSADRLCAMTLITLGAGLGALPVVLLSPLPQAASWPWLALGVALHTGYNVFLVRAYRVGDFGQAYPIARGSSPLLVSVGAALLVGEHMSGLSWLGVALISVGILSLAQLSRRMALAGPLTAFATGVFIAGYTVVDGLGARASGDALAYAGWLFLLDSPAILLLYLLRYRRLPWPPDRRVLCSGLGAGVLSLLAYGIVIWAVTLAPMGTVSALRETSVLFAALIGALFLGEKLTVRRVSSCLLITAGAMLLGLQR
ncbi:MAG: EamA family transporter [Polaromonas sp.]